MAENERLREEREGFMEQMNRMELETQAWLEEALRLREAIDHVLVAGKIDSHSREVLSVATRGEQ